MSKFYLTFQILTILIGVSLSADYLTEKPNWIKSCKTTDPSFTECTTNNMQGLIVKLSDGVPELKSLPPLDPYKISNVKVNQEGDGPVNMKIKLSDVSVVGFRKTIVNESRFSLENYSWKSKIFVPSISLDGDYAVQGRILLITLNSEGKIRLELENVDIKVLIKTILYEQSDLIFANVTSVQIDYTIRGLKVKMDNLFNGNKEIEDSANALFNENWQTLDDTMKPIIKETVQEILLDTFKRLFDHLPFKFFIEDIQK